MNLAPATTRALTPDRLVYDLRTANGPVISPDGATIALSLAQADRASGTTLSQLWLMDADGGNARQLTTSGHTNSGTTWSPDGQALAFISKRDGDRPRAICVVAAGGGETREVIRHAAKPSSLAWSPDGSRLAYTLPVDPANPDEHPADPDASPPVHATRRLDYKQDNRGYLYDTRLQVRLVEVATGAGHQLTTRLVDHTEPQWSPDGRFLAARVLNRNGMHQQLGLIDAHSGDTTLVGTEDWTVGTWRWSLDGSFILFDGDKVNSAQTDYFRYDVASGATVRLTDDLPFLPEAGYPTLGGPAQPAWLDQDTALVHGIQAGASGLWTIDARTGAIGDVARFEAVHTGLSVDATGRHVVQAITTPTRAGEVTAFDRERRESRVVTGFNDEFFAESPAGNCEKGSVERDGEVIDFWVTFPPGFSPDSNHPVVLDVHGGPHGNYGFSFNRTAQMLAAAGIIVVSSNPRGSGTYGRRFANLVRTDWGGGDWLDVQAALDAVLARPYADLDRTGIIGYSYGGFMTAWAIGHTNRYRAAVCGAPVFDLESFYGTSDIGHVWGAFQWGGELPAHRDWMLEHSPSTHIHHATTPTLILHGEADHRCPIGQGEQMFTHLSRQGVETEFVRYPGAAHLFLHSGPPAHKVDYYTRIRDWFTDRL